MLSFISIYFSYVRSATPDGLPVCELPFVPHVTGSCPQQRRFPAQEGKLRLQRSPLGGELCGTAGSVSCSSAVILMGAELRRKGHK